MEKATHLFLLIFVSFIFAPFLARGAVFTVNNPTEFQNALKTAQSNGENDTIYVAPGTYNITSTLTYSAADGDGSLTVQAKDMNNRPVLDGGNSVQIMSIENDSNGDYMGDEGDDIFIKGIVFQNGNYTIESGGGLYVKGGMADITLEGNTFSGNSASHFGGGVYVFTFYGTSTVTNNTFSENSANFGSGVFVQTNSGATIVTYNSFDNNSADWDGGGAYVLTEYGSTTITNNTFNKNYTGQNGGGALVYINSNSATITNNTFSRNSARKYGGGMYVELYSDKAVANIYNNILWGNTANEGGNDGDDLYIYSDEDNNNIGSIINLYNNDLGPNSDFDTGQSEDLYITDTDNYNQASNIKSDPLFVDPAQGDFHLKSGSPCIDKGLNNAPQLPSKDFEGDPRISDGNGDGNATVDIGADEYTSQSNTSSSPNSADSLGVVIAKAEDDGNVYLYVPSLLLSGAGGKSSVYKLLFKLEDIQSIMFRLAGVKALSTAPGPISAFFNPGQEILYTPYVALIDDKSNTTIFKNLTFFVAIGENEAGKYEVFIILRDLLGDQAPTITEYIGGTKEVGAGVPEEVSTYYLDTMSYIENLIKGTSFTTPQPPASSSTPSWDLQDW